MSQTDDSQSPMDVRAALEFAKGLADSEIKAIERLHTRTLTFIGFVLAVIVSGFGVIGWFGYSNLRTLAIGVATRTVQEETRNQVATKLTRENVNGIVAQQVENTTKQQLDVVLRKEIETTLRPPILEVARQQSESLLKGVFRQRELNQSQAAAFIAAIKEKEFLKGTFVEVANGDDPESLQFAWSVRQVVDASGMRGGTMVIVGKDIDFSSPNITVACVEAHKAKCEAVRAAFTAAGVESKLTTVPLDQVTQFAPPQDYIQPKDAKGNVIAPAKDDFVIIWCNSRKMTMQAK